MKHQITYVLKTGNQTSLDGLNALLRRGYCVVSMIKICLDTEVLIVLDKY